MFTARMSARSNSTPSAQFPEPDAVRDMILSDAAWHGCMLIAANRPINQACIPDNHSLR
jgi:hypothetical protein